MKLQERLTKSIRLRDYCIKELESTTNSLKTSMKVQEGNIVSDLWNYLKRDYQIYAIDDDESINTVLGVTNKCFHFSTTPIWKNGKIVEQKQVLWIGCREYDGEWYPYFSISLEDISSGKYFEDHKIRKQDFLKRRRERRVWSNNHEPDSN